MDSGRNSVLAVKDEVAAVPVTYLGLVGDSLIKILRDIFDLPELLIPLVSVAGNLQLAAVDDLTMFCTVVCIISFSSSLGKISGKLCLLLPVP